jgi:hypothetical protein
MRNNYGQKKRIEPVLWDRRLNHRFLWIAAKRGQWTNPGAESSLTNGNLVQ